MTGLRHAARLGWLAVVFLLTAICKPSCALAASATVPYSIINGHILVAARVNGQGPFTFVLDTGASKSFLDTKTARQIGLTVTGATHVNSFGNKPILAGISDPAGIAIGSCLLTGQTFLLLDMSTQYVAIGAPVQGVLGADVFRKFVVSFDNADAQMTLTPAAEFTAAGRMGALPLRFNPAGIPLVEASVNGASGWFEVDTGSSGGIVLYPNFFRSNRERFAGAKLSAPTVRGEVGGPVSTELIDSANIRIGPYSAVLRPLEILMSEPAQIDAPDIAGNIGESVLETFTVTFDYKDQTLFLLPSGQAKRPSRP